MVTLLVDQATASSSTPSADWLGPTLAIGSVLIGGGGITAIIKARHDRRAGVAQQELAEDDALSARWQSIIETQTKALVEPLTTRLGTLEGEVAALKVELEGSRRRYWSAVGYIRTLYTWIARRPEVDASEIPEAPALLAEDI